MKQSATPFLIPYATPRTDCAKTPGFYSPEDQMWMYETNNGIAPLIEQSSQLSELATKTDANTERDDQSFDPIVELATKTLTIQERDDEAMASQFSLDLATKTEATTESDDAANEIMTSFVQ